MTFFKRTQKLILNTVILASAIILLVSSSAFAAPSSTLKLGSKGLEVMEIQQVLVF